jgi:raffinose/stachyose/melibiose transport system substrate-binding protein
MRSKYFSYGLVVLLLLAVVCAPLFSGGKQEEASGDIELVVWINGSDSYIGPEEKNLPQDQWYISKAFKRFEEANPGVTIELVVPPDQEAAHQSFKAAALAGNAPDVGNMWTGQPIFALKDVILPLDDLVPADDLKNIIGWEAVRYGFKSDGVLLGYPASQNVLTFFLYNKKIIKQAGLDFEANPPTTVDEFDSAMEKIKNLGIVPIAIDESFPWLFAWIGDYWWAQVTDSATILEETEGKKKFSEDKGLLDALEYYHSLYANGYLNQDMGTSADSWNRFAQGKAAMTPVVTSFLADGEKALGKDCGVLMPPEIDANATITKGTIGGNGQSLIIAKDTKHPEMAVKLISFLNSKEEVLLLQAANTIIPARIDISLEELGWAEDSNIAKLFPFVSNYIYWVDNLLTSGVAEVFYKETPLVGLGKMTPMELALEMDKNAHP